MNVKCPETLKISEKLHWFNFRIIFGHLYFPSSKCFVRQKCDKVRIPENVDKSFKFLHYTQSDQQYV